MSDTYTRKNAVAFLVKSHGLTKSQADKILLDLFGDLAKALKKGQRVQLNPFGSFAIHRRAARKGRNPQTGATIKVPAKKVVKFKALAGLKGTIGK